LKWRLMVKSLPVVVGVVFAKLVLEHQWGFHGAIEFTDIGLVFTAGVFLIGLMLAGTMADYKESEKLPTDIACTLASLEVVYRQAATAKPELDDKRMHKEVLHLTLITLEWIQHKRTRAELDAALGSVATMACTLESSGLSSHASRVAADLNLLRRALLRIDVISRTGFLAVGYALLDSVVALIIGLLLVCHFRGPYEEILLVSFVTLIYVYAGQLIRDIDDPFLYQDGVPRGASEVELFPLIELRERMRRHH
jgi:hypothetical protein